MTTSWEVWVRLGTSRELVASGEADNIGAAVAVVHGLLPDVEPADAYAYGWVYIPAERVPWKGSDRPLKGQRLPGSRGVCWTRPGI